MPRCLSLRPCDDEHRLNSRDCIVWRPPARATRKGWNRPTLARFRLERFESPHEEALNENNNR